MANGKSVDVTRSYSYIFKEYYPQVRFFEWELVDIYADEGITGTRSDKREEFQRMLSDCRKGRIDRILVKPVSRFARNIHDCLSTVREMKVLGIEVEFEEDGLKTADMHDEMMIGAFSSIAQENPPPSPTICAGVTPGEYRTAASFAAVTPTDTTLWQYAIVYAVPACPPPAIFLT